MALLDRIKARVSTDLTDAELQLMIDAVTAEIARRYGAIAAITERMPGSRVYISLARPIDTGETVTVAEVDPQHTGDSGSETTLAADDYRVLHGGRILERLLDGTNGRREWAPEVKVSYTPIDDSDKRDGITLEIVELQIRNPRVGSERYGDSSSNYLDVTRERERLYALLAPRGRGGMA